MTKTRHSGCPFWSPTSGNCKISLEGLFIPLQHHIDTFCRTEDFCHCEQHRGKNGTGEMELCHTVAERRRFDRHSGSQKITIVPADEYMDDNILSLSAQVIDFSRGGIRLLASKQLDRDLTVTCSFDDSFPDHLQSGDAKIRWCRPLLNCHGYQAGLSFKDEQLSLALSSYLDHHVM